MIKPGIYPYLSNEEYHSDTAISRSAIMDFIDTPYKYWGNYINPNRPQKEYTDAMRIGSAFHTLILEPKKFADEYAIEPERVYLKYNGKEAYEAYKQQLAELQNTNKTILSLDEYRCLKAMQSSLLEHEAWGLIEGAVYEQSYFWEDEHTGIMCKARPDILHEHMIVDLKTCVDASSRAFQRTMVEGGYHIQGAMIREAIKQNTGVIIPAVINIAVEKCYPFTIGIKIIGQDALEIGHLKFKQALLDIKACHEKKQWSSYESEIVELPAWAR